MGGSLYRRGNCRYVVPRTRSLVLPAALPALESPSVQRYSELALAVLPPFSLLTNNLRGIAVVCVQLKAVGGRYPQYVVFYHLTRPRICR